MIHRRALAQTLYLALSFVIVSGCANIMSIGRRSDLPGGGTAVHLDAKQRVVVAKDGIVCAEPSPDALSAYASSISGAIALPNQASASLAQALQESSASIGLRTQSITLMRDALYRICEAYYAGKLRDAQVMSLLARTQDLTLGILAIEQLTGAVAAQQVALGGSANAAASSTLSTNQQLLEQATKNESKKKSDLTANQTKITEKKAEIARIEEEIKRLTAERGKLPEKEKDPKWQELTSQIDEQGKKKTTAEGESKALEQEGATAKALLAQATETREAIEKNYAVALTQANAAASGFGVFSDSPRIIKLNDESTKHIAKAVTEIVTTVVSRSHAEDNCFSLVSTVYNDFKSADEKIKAKARGGLEAAKIELNPAEKVAKALIEGDSTVAPPALQNAFDYCDRVLTAITEAKGPKSKAASSSMRQ